MAQTWTLNSGGYFHGGPRVEQDPFTATRPGTYADDEHGQPLYSPNTTPGPGANALYQSPTTWGQEGAATPAQQLYKPPPPGDGGLLDPGTGTGATAAFGTPLEGTTTGAAAIGNTDPVGEGASSAGLANLTRDTIINILAQGTPSASDPNIAAQTAMFNAAQQRAAGRKMNAAAEAFGAGGMESSGAQLAAQQGIMDDQGLAEGTFGAGLMQQELTARRAQIEHALTLASATTDQDLNRRLQEELAKIDAALRETAIALNARLGDADIDSRNKIGTGNLNLGLLKLLLEDRQFGDQLGFNIASLEGGMNNAAVRNILGIS
jgi:hypothetical protein